MNPTVLMWEHHSWTSPIRVGGRAFAEGFLREGWSVAWLNGPLALWNLWGGNDEVRRRRTCWTRRGEDQSWDAGRLFAYAPLSPVPYRNYPILDRPWFHRHALDVTWPRVFPILAAKGFAEVDLLWLATGSPLLPLLERVRHRRSLYRLSDDTPAFPDTPRSYRSLEEEAMRRVDGVIATAYSLAERARRLNPRVLLLPNGVHLARFARAGERDRRTDSGRRRPRVVYVGVIDSWFDTARVAALSRALPEVDFHLAGPLRIGSSWAAPLPNVRLGGPVPSDDVPDLLAGCDVGIIPFVDSPLTRAIHPVKLYEYFAAGLPVVATDLEEIRRMASPALLARHDDEWIDAVRDALKSPGRRAEYLAFAGRHDWSGRFDRLLAFLEGIGAGCPSGAVREGTR